MISKTVIFTLFLSAVIIGGSSSAWAAQLDVRVNPTETESEFSVRYQRTAFLEYNEGGELADQLRGQSWKILKTFDSSSEGMDELKNRINQKLASDGSITQIGDLNVDYQVSLTGRGLNTSLDYKVLLYGTITNYNIREMGANSPGLVDMAWRGITVEGPVVLDGTEINLPISPIKENQPVVNVAVEGTDAEELLLTPIINADGIRDQPLTNWHFLFDPTGINVDAGTFGLDESIAGFVVSSFTMGESSFREGQVREKVFEAEFTVDRPYTIRTVESADSGNVFVIGFAAVDSIDGSEVFGVSPRAPEGFATTSTGEFPVLIIYGMAAMAAIGGAGIFIFSNRKLKKEEGQTTQTGIDPSNLQGYQTSAGAGGYQTNRGEAQLKDGSDYQQHTSVYDEQKPAEDTSSSSSTKGSMPKGWKPEN